MRVTNSMLTDRFMRNLSTNLAAMDRIQEKLSSGKEVSRPSDDPVKLQQILKLDTALDQTNQYVRNIDSANSFLGTIDAALNQAGALLSRANELATRSLNGTMDQDAQNANAEEINQLLDQLVQVANTNVAGQYVFAGTDTSHKPFSIVGGAVSVAKTFNTNAINFEIGPKVMLQVNTVATDAFGKFTWDATGKVTPDQDAFSALSELSAAMKADDKTAMQTAIDKLTQASESMLTARTNVGARMNRLETTNDRFQDDIINLTDLKSKSEDIDPAKVIMDLKSQESAYQAALAAGARIIQPSLVDFLK